MTMNVIIFTFLTMLMVNLMMIATKMILMKIVKLILIGDIAFYLFFCPSVGKGIFERNMLKKTKKLVKVSKFQMIDRGGKVNLELVWPVPCGLAREIVVVVPANNLSS